MPLRRWTMNDDFPLRSSEATARTLTIAERRTRNERWPRVQPLCHPIHRHPHQVRPTATVDAHVVAGALEPFDLFDLQQRYAVVRVADHQALRCTRRRRLESPNCPLRLAE